ncbi:unnamed protein product [Microthlaspi erraticum]|uniref:Reverse transcriptase zinc-binding domain-containing protein n=1 Tax=Microthlaspi erraticum TaxID=1685480 RepID=A0A6D2IHM8_9BRAS|nr:unnamed protein product [Microthlaspi erraticum]
MGFFDQEMYIIGVIPSPPEWRGKRVYQSIKRPETRGSPIPFSLYYPYRSFDSTNKSTETEGRITGLKIAQTCPQISHLLFTDDSIFFCKADIQQCTELMRIFTCYGQASGQQLNATKSSIFFGSKVPQDDRIALKRALGITKEGGMGLYLGLPENICGSKQKVFTFVQERLAKRINTWSAKFLSKGGKEVLIKSVAQALPTYVMSCFLLPKSITNKLQSAISRFWWSTKQNNKGMHWIAWEKICIPLEEGGLGFRDLKNFNIALLAKQLWRILHYPSSLLARVLKARYFRHSNPLDIEKSNAPSCGWRSMLAAKELLKAGIRKNIGSGVNTMVWKEPWIPTTPARPPMETDRPSDPFLYVHHLIDHDTKSWKEELPLRSGYTLAMKLKNTEQDQALTETSTTALKGKVWTLKTVRKIKHFLWQAIAGCIPVRQNLVSRHCGTDKSCPRCNTGDETINHLLFECPLAVQTWSLSNLPSEPDVFPNGGLFQNLDQLLWRIKEGSAPGGPDNIIARWPWIIWYIWKARNEKLFNDKEIQSEDTIQLAYTEADTFAVAQVGDRVGETNTAQGVSPHPLEDASPVTHCQIDASWLYNGNVFGGGMVIDDVDGGRTYGSCARTQVISPLHAEFHTLLWAMKEVLTLGYTSMTFETDCMQLIKLLEEEDTWPSVEAELEEFNYLSTAFVSFAISFIPRSCNGCADRLSKEARARGSIHSVVNNVMPSWLVV